MSKQRTIRRKILREHPGGFPAVNPHEVFGESEGDDISIGCFDTKVLANIAGARWVRDQESEHVSPWNPLESDAYTYRLTRSFPTG